MSEAGTGTGGNGGRNRTPDSIRRATDLHVQILERFAMPDILEREVLLKSSDRDSIELSIRFARRRDMPANAFAYMLHLGYALCGISSRECDDVMPTYVFRKVDCEFALETTETGRLVTRAKMFKFLL